MNLPSVFADLLTWFSSEVLPPAIVVAALGFVFREKWRQILTRSLSKELEGYKHELALNQAQHAASLAPQLEAVKHEFQQKIESYKVSLIAEAEAVKLRTDVRRTIANRYVEVQFERLIQLERDMCVSADFVLIASHTAHGRSPAQLQQAIDLMTRWQESQSATEMFLNEEEVKAALAARAQLQKLLSHVGAGKAPISVTAKDWEDGLYLLIHAKTLLRAKIGVLTAV